MMNNKLINKDIEKVNILIDTQDLVSTQSDRSHSDYVIKFNDDGTNNTAGFGGVFRNVIGLRLKSAIIRHDPISLDASNGVINSAGTDMFLLKANYGFYSGTGLATLFKDKTKFGLTNNLGSGGVPSTDPLPSCSFNNITQKFTFTNVALDFTGSDPKNNLARVLGFNKTFNGNTTTSSFPIDLTPHFVDVVVDELPYIACKQNASGRKIIDRIPITVPVGGIQSYKVDPAELQSQNYFFPITLSQLSIKLFTDKDNLIKSSDEQHSLEFEITMLKHNKFR
jgi:hypothetical protein